MKEQVDVVIVGAGPVGLLAAIELTLGGVSMLVLERLLAPSTALKALSIGALGSEALQRRGLAAAIDAAEARSFAAMEQFADRPGPNPHSKFSGHFGGLFIRKDAQKDPARRPRAVDQQDLEAMLAERAADLGIALRRGCDVTGFVQQADGIDVAWTSPSGGGDIRCSYLIGCDGGRSLIRKQAGFEFPGTAPSMTLYQAVAAIDHPERLLPRGWTRTSEGVFVYGPFPGRLFLLDFSGPPENREAPVTRDEIETVLRRISGQDVRVTALESGSRWTDNTRLVDRYRRGRVLLAGDAAHVHSPFGGQGLSLGLGDAANLGWKLAAVLRGDLPERLLDSYTAERRPVAEAVLANTLAQAALMRPDPQSGALRDIVAKLMQVDEVSRSIGEMTSSLALRYDLGAERDEVGRLIGDAALYDSMQDGSGVLLDATSGEAARLVAATTPRIRCSAVETGPSMLIRPDACIAWVGEANSIDGLPEALARWFKSPTEGTA